MLSAARKTNYRDYVILAVMAGCGLREAEVRTLTDPRIRHAAEELGIRLTSYADRKAT